MRITSFSNICMCLASISLAVSCTPGTASITEPAASVTKSKKLTADTFGCEGVDPEENPGELVCWINRDNRTRPALRATLTRHESDEGAWLEASVENKEASHPYKATAIRPLSGETPVRFDNVFIELPSHSTLGEFDSATFYSGEPDFDEVDAPHYRAGIFVENHGQPGVEVTDFGAECILRCDGKGDTRLVEPVVDVTIPVEERPEVALKCRAWGAGYGSAEAPAVTSNDVLIPGKVSDRPGLVAAHGFQTDPGVREVLNMYQVDMAEGYSMAPSTYALIRFVGAAAVYRRAMSYSSGPLGYDKQDNRAYHFAATRIQMGARSDPRSFTIDCNLEFEAPWVFKE